MFKYRVRVEDNYHGKQAILVEMYDEEYQSYEMLTAYPIENFNKNAYLAQLLMNQLSDCMKCGEVKFEYKELGG